MIGHRKNMNPSELGGKGVSTEVTVMREGHTKGLL